MILTLLMVSINSRAQNISQEFQLTILIIKFHSPSEQSEAARDFAWANKNIFISRNNSWARQSEASLTSLRSSRFPSQLRKTEKNEQQFEFK